MRLSDRSSRFHWRIPRPELCSAVVEFAEAANAVKSGEIPLTRKEHRFPSHDLYRKEFQFSRRHEHNIVDVAPEKQAFSGFSACLLISMGVELGKDCCGWNRSVKCHLESR
ncbi:MAG: hypothetical protein JJE16_00110 [Nitrospiraceae bacterium]|nr:hypothetical protein [Nitrospiraceae bacterium]